MTMMMARAAILRGAHDVRDVYVDDRVLDDDCIAGANCDGARMTHPEPVRDEELYDPFAEIPPEPQNVRPLFSAPITEVHRPDPKPEQPPTGPKPKEQVLAALLDILSFRNIMLICCLCSAAMFMLAIVWPDVMRLGAAIAFSLIVTAPVVILYRKAD